MDIQTNYFECKSKLAYALKSTKSSDSLNDHLQESASMVAIKDLIHQDYRRDHQEDPINDNIVSTQVTGFMSLKSFNELNNRIHRFKASLAKDELLVVANNDDQELALY